MSAEQLHASRAEQRKQRLLEVERELDAEEAEALKMTEEQRQLLLQPFKTVKAEFADLDGLRWTQTALRKFQPPHRCATQPAAQPHAVSTTNTFVVLTNADLASFSPEDTIRIPTTAYSRPSFPSPLLPQQISLPTNDIPCRHRDGGRTRSPIKGLFPPGTDPAYDPVPSSTPDSSSELMGVSERDKTGGVGCVNASYPGVVFRGRSKKLVPPGLDHAPMYSRSSSDLHSASLPSHPFGSSKHHDNASPDISPRNNPISLQRHPSNFAPLPHRDAPSPPSELISLPPASSRLEPTALIDPLIASSQPHRANHQHRSPRARLHALLQDDRRTTMRASALKPPSRPAQRAAPGDITPTPLELSAIITSIQGGLYDDDDDETPRVSPVDAGGGQRSPSFSWIQELAA